MYQMFSVSVRNEKSSPMGKRRRELHDQTYITAVAWFAKVTGAEYVTCFACMCTRKRSYLHFFYLLLKVIIAAVQSTLLTVVADQHLVTLPCTTAYSSFHRTPSLTSHTPPFTTNTKALTTSASPSLGAWCRATARVIRL